MINKLDKNQDRVARHARVRKNLSGTSERPRLDVFRSLTHIYAQIIDDVNGVTLVAVNTKQKELASELKGKNKKEQAFVIGQEIAKRAIEKGIKTVVFDRGGYIYTGRVAQVAEGARKGGLAL